MLFVSLLSVLLEILCIQSHQNGLQRSVVPQGVTSTAYEWASFYPLVGPEVTKPYMSGPSMNYSVNFDAFHHHFTVQLYEMSKEEYGNVEVTVVEPQTRSTYYIADQVRYYRGRVDELKPSRAHGVLRSNGLFEGIIETSDEVYFVESQLRFFGKSNNSFGAELENKAIVYRWKDLRQFPIESACSRNDPSCFYYQTIQHYKALLPPQDSMPKKGERQASRSKAKARSCPVHVVADHRFFRYVGFQSVQKTLEAIVWHIEEVDHLYRETDWDSDSIPDRIGVSLKKVTIFTSEDSPGNPFARDTSDDEEFLKKFSEMDTSDVCMALVFTFTELKGTFGISYVGTVCNPWYNWILVNFRNVNGEVRQRAASVITVMHEIAHVFGANHDEEDRSCSPAGSQNGPTNGGNYIMYPSSAFGMHENNRRFSPCSITAVSRNMQDTKKTKCFVAI